MKKIILLFSVFILLVSSCQNREDSANFAVAVAEPAMENMDLKIPEKEASSNQNQTIEPKIIKNANLSFETQDLEETYSNLVLNLKKHNASIQNDSQGKEYNKIYRNLIIRVPSANFDAFISQISKGVAYFDFKEISASDVTEQFIDLTARVKTKKELENRYFELLKKASKVSEIIEIEKQLSEIRAEIESKEGQLKYLNNQVSMSTVSINFYKTTAEKQGATVSFGIKIKNAIVSGFNSISSFFVGLLEVWPFILILVAVIFSIKKRFKKKSV